MNNVLVLCGRANARAFRRSNLDQQAMMLRDAQQKASEAKTAADDAAHHRAANKPKFSTRADTTAPTKTATSDSVNTVDDECIVCNRLCSVLCAEPEPDEVAQASGSSGAELDGDTDVAVFKVTTPKGKGSGDIYNLLLDDHEVICIMLTNTVSRLCSE